MWAIRPGVHTAIPEEFMPTGERSNGTGADCAMLCRDHADYQDC